MEPSVTAPKLLPAPSMPALHGLDQAGDLPTVAAHAATSTQQSFVHTQALDICLKLDAALARGLPMLPNDKTSNQNSEEYTRRNLHEYIEAAKWLESYFVSIRSQTNPSTRHSLQKEIMELEEELKVKDQVIAGCSDKLKDWSQRLRTLQDACNASQNAI